MPAPRIVLDLASWLLLVGPGLAQQAPRLRPLTPRPIADETLARVLGGLERIDLERGAVDLFLAGDVDGDGLADVALVDQAWRMCGNDPAENRLRLLSSASLAVLFETEGEELEADFDPTAGLAVEQDLTAALGRLDLGRDPVEQDLDTWSADLASAHLRRAYDLAFVGDVDGDGVGDLALLDAWATRPLAGAPDEPEAWTGGLELRSGADGTALWSAFGALHTGGFGMSACAAGDVDGDGRTDVAVLASPVSLPGERTFVALRSGLDGRELCSIGLPRGTQGGELEPIDDVDGDGRPDLLLRCAFGVGLPGGAGLPDVDEVAGCAVLGSATHARVELELPGSVAWTASTRTLPAATRALVGPAVLGVVEPGDRQSLWVLGTHGPRRLRTLGPDEAAWSSAGPALVALVGQPPRACVLLGDTRHEASFGTDPRLLVLPLGR